MKAFKYGCGLLLVMALPAVAQTNSKPKKMEGSPRTMEVVGLSRSRLVVFDADKPQATPKLMIYKALPKAEEVSDQPLLIAEFAKTAGQPESDSATVRPERVMMEQATRRRKNEPNTNQQDQVDDGEQTGEASKTEFDDDDIEY